VTFFRGTSLRPRYLDIHEDDELDDARFAGWVRQASRLPGWGKS
jgi:hypothetical protein